MKRNKKLFLYNIILFIIFFINKDFYNYYILIFSIFLIYRFGFPKNKSFFKENTVQIVIISLLAYFFISYSLGILTGFKKNIFNYSFLTIIKNIFPILILILCEELIRYVYAKNSKIHKKNYILLTIIFILINCINLSFGYNFKFKENIFKYIFVVIFPTISHHLLYSYITYNIGYLPTILLRMTLNLYIYIVPFFPDLGDYLISASGIIFPFIVYKPIDDMLTIYNKDKKYLNKVKRNYFYIPIIIILICYVSLIVGIGRYKLIAIASGSMEPSFYRGDAILYKKISDLNELKIGTIIAFEKNNTLVTHRIKSIIKNDNVFIITKGDNNLREDPFLITTKEIKGIVTTRIPYIGYPTVWLNEKF